MKDSKTGKKTEFLYIDENVKYTVVNNGNSITLNCDHPIFVNRFKSDTATLGLEDFFNASHKGSRDYDFLQKFKTSLQEDFLDSRT